MNTLPAILVGVIFSSIFVFRERLIFLKFEISVGTINIDDDSLEDVIYK